MAESPSFEWLSERIEADTSLNRLSARGTLRLALKKCGLQPSTVTPQQLAVVLRDLLPKELEARGVDSAEFCPQWASSLEAQQAKLEAPSRETATDVLRRILQAKL